MTDPQQPEQDKTEREYEQSGMYPEKGKAFRIWALLGWLAGIIVFLAVVSAIADIFLLQQ